LCKWCVPLAGTTHLLYVVHVSNADLVTTAEAVQITGRTRWSLYRLVKQGRLPVAMKLPAATGAYMFDRADVEALRKEIAA
jgi:predicted DNA-binding transcriptional regulator AlpA